MSFDIAEIISAMEFAAREGIFHYLHDDGRTRLALWREAAIAPAATPVAAPPPAAPEPRPAVSEQMVTAPLPGLCHLAPDPASPPFVREGDTVTEGQTLCIIEAMKVMTAVAAPTGGRLARVLVANGSTVAGGQPLMEIVP